MISDISFMAIGLKTKVRKSHKINILWVYEVQMRLDLFSDHYFNFFGLKLTEMDSI